MINIIPITIDERGGVKKDIQILAMDGENLSERLQVTLPDSIIDKWLYIEFEKPSGEKFVSEKLEANGNYLNYDITNQLTDVGKLICQVIAKNSEELVWKSNKFDFTILSSINAMEEIPASSPDILADLQNQIDNIGTGGGSTIPVVEVSGSDVTIEPNKHYVISGITNSLTITLSEPITTELKKYSFEFSSVDRTPKVTINGVEQPLNYEYGKYTKYLCEIINNKLVILGTYDGYEYQFIYGAYATSDWSDIYTLKNNRTFVRTLNSANTNGTYQVEYTNNEYWVNFTFDGGDFKSGKYSDGTITIDGVVYTKS
jgi:hypothetical protein